MDQYHGETARNGHTRGIEHVEDMESNNEERKEKSVLLRHINEKHSGEKVDFDMKVVRSYQHDALARQCAEAVWIKNVEPEKRINNKKEYHQPGDVEIRYKKNENEEVKMRKAKTKKPTDKIDKNYKNVENATKNGKNDRIEPTIIDFIKKVRFENEKENDTDTLISTQEMTQDSEKEENSM